MPLVQSVHNISGPIADSDTYYIVNLLSQQADIISKEQYERLQAGQLPSEDWVAKGYWVEKAEEDKRYRAKYLEFIDNRDADEVQLFYVPTYQCNFNCSYCYQDEYNPQITDKDFETARAFFQYIDAQFSKRRKYITLFGGEPLLNTPKQRQLITHIIEQANARNLDIAIVSNAFHLTDYIDLLRTARIREVQVTLDGVGEMHNHRRPLKGGGESFERIVEGVDAALKAGLPINLRMVVDKENINELPKLARFAIDKGWTVHPLFKTQLGRNYELHHCQTEQGRLYSRLGMYEDLFQLLKAHPEIEEFHRPAFSISKFLFEQGELPSPLFDSCPGTKTEWAFDSTGKIYSCTATVGKAGEELGTFYPHVQLNEGQIALWEERDVLSIAECEGCNLQLACGGGCGSVAKNQKGHVCKPDCRPVQELLSLGIGHYYKL